MSEVASNDASDQNTAQTTSAPPSPPPFNVELKKTKVVWAQPAGPNPTTWTETMMELVEFRKMLDERDEKGPLAAIPAEHTPLIAKLTQESDKDLKSLIAEIQKALLPEPIQSTSTESTSDVEILPLKVVEATVKRVAKRVNYGIDGGLQNFCVWRWELEDMALLPTRIREMMIQRRNDRQRGQAVLLSLYQAVPEADRKSMLLKSKQKKQEAPSGGGKENIPEPADVAPMVIDAPSATAPSSRANSEAPKASKSKGKDKEPKPKKSATKTREATPVVPAKGNLLGWFAPKPKAGESSTTAKPTRKADPAAMEVVEKKPTFDEIFQPFRVKKSTTLAPINHFKQMREVIILDGEGEGEVKTEYINNSKGKSPLEAMKASPSRPRTTRYTQLHASAPVLKTTSKLSVRDLIEQLNDATMAGDVNSAKALISTLSDREKLPLRWLHFWDNTRPMYIGTWSKTSRFVGPRTPFAKEEGVNYEYDSGEDWVEEEEGEEMEDLETLDGDEEEEEEEENNDWIVDDDEEELEEDVGGLVLSLDEIGSDLVALPSKGKRKAEGGGMYSLSRMNKRRKLVPLKPICKGPHWETVLGIPEVPSWSQYSIRVLNDTPLFIDPLVVYNEPVQATTKAKDATGFVIPAIPDRLLPTSSSGDASTSALPAKKRGSGQNNAAGAKPILPDHLVQKMAGLVLEAETGTTQVLLVDKVHQALKGEGAKKNTIEATLKQVFEKEKGKKRWVVREEYRGVVGNT